MPLICHFFGENFEIPHLKPNQNLKEWCQQELSDSRSSCLPASNLCLATSSSCDYFGGDIQKFSSKLPGFYWSKYPNEKHIPGYVYLGQMPVA